VTGKFGHYDLAVIGRDALIGQMGRDCCVIERPIDRPQLREAVEPTESCWNRVGRQSRLSYGARHVAGHCSTATTLAGAKEDCAWSKRDRQHYRDPAPHPKAAWLE
jgi:hypothetical protein